MAVVLACVARKPRRDGQSDVTIGHHIDEWGMLPGHAVIVVQGAAKSEGDAHQGRETSHAVGAGSLSQKAELELELGVLSSVLLNASKFYARRSTVSVLSAVEQLQRVHTCKR